MRSFVDNRPFGPFGWQRNTLVVFVSVISVGPARAADQPDLTSVPGVVIDYSPAASKSYIGSPSIVILDNGNYVASHDFFGPGTKYNRVAVFVSRDRGMSWQRQAVVEDLFWPTLFVHRHRLYMIGASGRYGYTVIRRSDDGGNTWTKARDKHSGLLLDDARYHCAPQPVVVHNGRIWRAMEDAMGGGGWGKHFRAFMMSVSVDADLLRADSWTCSNRLQSDPGWLDGRFNGWLEGNAVMTPEGKIVNILRVDDPKVGGQAALVRISADGKTTTFEPATGFIGFPGANTKFTLRADPKAKGYWALANYVPPRHEGRNKGGTRNTLALTYSPDLESWQVRCILLYHPDVKKHGFQYPDWQFDDDDLVAVSRTAYDDGVGGAHNFHDANFLTFHRISKFRSLTMADSVIDPEELKQAPKLTLETSDFIVEGRGIDWSALDNGALAYGNRRYVWKNVPGPFRGWRYTQTNGGEQATITVKAKRNTILYIATASKQKGVDLTGWEPVQGGSFSYSAGSGTPMQILSRPLQASSEMAIPQGNWSGVLVLIPPETATLPVKVD